MRWPRCLICFLAATLGFAFAAPALAQMEHAHHHAASARDSTDHHSVGADEGMKMSGMEHDHAMHGAAMYGPYPMTREASGTAWQPDLAMHRGIHGTRGSWSLLAHGAADLAADKQGGGRGDKKVFSSNMLMGMAQRPLGPGRLGLRAMISIEPATIGKEGYPLLLQTGETADGRTPLIDRQHPHDLLNELAVSYSLSRGSRSLFLYAGLPGEPALGPPAFPHRFSGSAIPQAPITHHWLDSSHVSYGVLTAGAVAGRLKLETSVFRGREPDQDRYDLESPKLDSHSFRVSLNPTPAWALQASYGRLTSPEQLEPSVDTDRTTVSIIHAADRAASHWETTLAWGRNRNRPGETLDGFALESALRLHGKITLFARAEHVGKDELFPEGSSRAGHVYEVSEMGAGARYDFWTSRHVVTGMGLFGTISLVPDAIEDTYGDAPASGMIFAHAELH